MYDGECVCVSVCCVCVLCVCVVCVCCVCVCCVCVRERERGGLNSRG